MINSFLILAIVVALLWLLAISRRDRTEAGIAGGRDASESAVRLPDRALLDLCLSTEDLEFAGALNSAALVRLFVRERRRLAVLWLRQARREASSLYDRHVRSVRHAPDLRPAAEVRLFAAYLLFLLVYAVMVSTVQLYGPFRTRRLLQGLQVLAGVLSGLGERLAGGLVPPLGPRMSTAGGE